MLKVIKNSDGKFGYQELDETGKIVRTGTETFATEAEAKKFVADEEAKDSQ